MMQILLCVLFHIILYIGSMTLNGYYTFSGNPFSNNLVCKNGPKDNLDWKEISMKTLEGGKEAFGERGKIYGN